MPSGPDGSWPDLIESPNRDGQERWLGVRFRIVEPQRETLPMSMNIAALADQVLVDPDHGEHRLGDLWAEQPQVILFLRHFG